jgi:hypothetical protein
MENKCCQDSHGSETCCIKSHEGGAGACTSKSDSCCPIQKATEMWTHAFFEAKKQICIEILKVKIQKAWGSKLNKTADAVLNTMEVEWKAMLAKGKAKMDLKEQMLKIMAECEK